MACHSSANRKYSLGGGHTLNVLRAGFKTHKHNSFTCGGRCLSLLSRKVNLSGSGSRRGWKSLSYWFGSFKSLRVEHRVKKLVKLFRLYLKYGLLFCYKALVNHVNGYFKGGGGCSFSVSCLKEEKLAVFYCKLHVLHVFIMSFKL